MNRECPICGKNKQIKHLVCSDCYNVYNNEAGHSLARDGKIQPFTAWACERIEKRLGEMKAMLVLKDNEYGSLQEQVRADAYTLVVNSLHGKKISRDIFKNALAEKKKEIWKARRGDRLYYELKTTESKVVFLQGLKDELYAKIQSFESPPATEVPLLVQAA